MTCHRVMVHLADGGLGVWRMSELLWHTQTRYLSPTSGYAEMAFALALACRHFVKVAQWERLHCVAVREAAEAMKQPLPCRCFVPFSSFFLVFPSLCFSFLSYCAHVCGHQLCVVSCLCLSTHQVGVSGGVLAPLTLAVSPAVLGRLQQLLEFGGTGLEHLDGP